MIAVVHTAWELVWMTLVFLAGALLVRAAGRWFAVSPRHALALYLWHSTFCAVYLAYSLTHGADALYYFNASHTWNGAPLPGTQMVIAVTAFLTQGLGLSYGGTFFVFNIPGAIGLIAFAAAMQVAVADISFQARRIALLLPFLPGLSFWSAAIGKDALTFFASGLLIWAAAAPYKRLVAIAVALGVVALVRPHIAAFMLIALCFAFLFDRHRQLVAKLVMTAVLLPVTMWGLLFARSYVGLGQAQSLADIGAYLLQRQGTNLGGGSSIDIASLSVVERLFGFIFRPLFLDADGIFGLVVSLENLALLGLVSIGVLAALKRRSSLGRFQWMFCFICVVITLGVLANTTANLGLAIRQKIMVTPMLLMLVLSYWPTARQARVAGQAPQTGLAS